jgi:hypothetical protein
MRRWILGDGTGTELGLDLEKELKKLDGFETVSFEVDGQRKVFQVADIQRRAELELGCQECLQKQLEIDSLRAQLQRFETPATPPLESIVKKFIEDNYEFIVQREYSRRDLRHEIDVYLKDTYNRRMHRESSLWRYVRESVLGDRSKQYRRLKLRRRMAD